VLSACVDCTLVTGNELYRPGTYMVNINGNIIGLTSAPKRFVTNFRKLRRAGRMSEFVSIFINQHHRVVYIASDGGRICRPMIIVDANGRPRVTARHMQVRSSATLPEGRLSCLTDDVRALLSSVPSTAPQGGRDDV
jgi:DNA-directed RNA polymerase beta subunit